MKTSRWVIIIAIVIGFVAAVYAFAAYSVTSCRDPDVAPFCGSWTTHAVDIPDPKNHIDVGHEFHIQNGAFDLNLLVLPQGKLKTVWGDRNSLRKKKDGNGEVCLWTTIEPLHPQLGGGAQTEQPHFVLFVRNDISENPELVVCMTHEDKLSDKCDCRSPDLHNGAAHVHP